MNTPIELSRPDYRAKVQKGWDFIDTLKAYTLLIRYNRINRYKLVLYPDNSNIIIIILYTKLASHWLFLFCMLLAILP